MPAEGRWLRLSKSFSLMSLPVWNLGFESRQVYLHSNKGVRHLWLNSVEFYCGNGIWLIVFIRSKGRRKYSLWLYSVWLFTLLCVCYFVTTTGFGESTGKSKRLHQRWWEGFIEPGDEADIRRAASVSAHFTSRFFDSWLICVELQATCLSFEPGPHFGAEWRQGHTSHPLEVLTESNPDSNINLKGVKRFWLFCIVLCVVNYC